MGKQIKGLNRVSNKTSLDKDNNGIKGLNRIKLPTSKVRGGERTNVGLTGIGESQFDKNIPLSLIDNLNTIRAERQPVLHQASHAILGGIASGVMTAGENLSLLLDLPAAVSSIQKYWNEEEELNAIEGNAIQEAFADGKDWLNNEFMPIYRKNPNKVLDFNDSGFYFEAIRGVVDSGVGFGLSGMGAGAAVKGAGAALRLARVGNLSRKLNQGLNVAGKALQQGRAGQITTGLITNHAENRVMALELYESSQEEMFNQFVEQYKEDNGEAPDEQTLKEFRLDAKINAGKQANDFLLKGKMFAGIDILQLNRMFRGVGKGISRSLETKPGVKEFLKSQFSPKMMAKESFEEIGQNTLQQELQYQARKNMLDKGYKLPDKDVDEMTFGERLISFATSEQALLEGAMGALGGPIQYTVTQAYSDAKNRKKRQQRYTSQQNMFKENENFVANTLYKEWLKEENIKEASKILEGEVDGKDVATKIREINNDITFTNQAVSNFERGTTANFEQHINDILADENLNQKQREYVQKKKDLLTELEADYNNNTRKYAQGALISAKTNANKTFREGIKTYQHSESLVKNNLREALDITNKLQGTNYTMDMVLDDKTNLNDEFVKAFKPFETIVDNLKKHQEQIDSYNKLIKENTAAIESYKADDAIYEEYNEIKNTLNPVDTKNKIEAFKELKKYATQDYTKEFLDKNIKALEHDYKSTKNNESIESKGGSEKVKKAAQKANGEIDEELERQAESFNDSFLQDKDVDNISSKFSEAELAALLDESNPSKISAAIEAKLADVDLEGADKDNLEKILNKYKGTDIDALADAKADQEVTEPTDIPDDVEEVTFKEANIDDTQIGDDVTPAKPVKEDNAVQSDSTSTSNEVIKDSPKSSKGVTDGVKMNYTKPTKAHAKYLTSNRDKTGDDVKYEVNNFYLNQPQNKRYKALFEKYKKNPALFESESNQGFIDGFPLNAVFNNESDNIASLFPVKPPSKVDPNKSYAFQVERKLRTQIIRNLINGQPALSKVKYQYSGAFISDGNIKSVYDIQGINNSDSINTILYTNSKGKLTYADGTPYESMSTVTVKKNGRPYVGQIFLPIQSSNGEVPLKLNIKPYTDEEISVISQAYRYIINPENNKEGVNVLETLLSSKELEKITDLVNQADLEYLGPDAKLKDLISHLVYEFDSKTPRPDGTLGNPESQLYFKNSKLYYGRKANGQPHTITAEQLNDLATSANFTAFLKTFKKRNVQVSKLNNDDKYKALIFDNKILNTDVGLDESGNPFQSVNTKKESLRYQTKAIYTETDLSNKIEGKSSTQSLQDALGNPPAGIEITEEISKKPEKSSNLVKNKTKNTMESVNKSAGKKINMSKSQVSSTLDMINKKNQAINKSPKEEIKKNTKKGKC